MWIDSDDSAMPPDVRKRSALPFSPDKNSRLRPRLGKPERPVGFVERPKAFGTSDGTATDFLAKLNREQSFLFCRGDKYEDPDPVRIDRFVGSLFIHLRAATRRLPEWTSDG